MARPKKNLDHVKITIEVPRGHYQQFLRLHPIHGAFTAWLRKALRLHVEQTRSVAEGLAGDVNE